MTEIKYQTEYRESTRLYLLLIFILISILISLRAYGDTETLKIDETVSVEIVNNRMNISDASRLFKYATEYLYNTKGDYQEAYETLEKIRKYYGKELEDNCILWQAKCKFKLNKNDNEVIDLLYKIEILYPDGDVYNSREMKETIKEIIEGLFPEQYPAADLKRLILYYDYLKRLKCNQDELVKIRQLITNELLKKTLDYYVHRVGTMRLETKPSKNFFVSEGVLIKAIKGDIFYLDNFLEKIEGFANKNFYLNFANYIYDHNLYTFNYKNPSYMEQTEILIDFEIRLKPLNLFEILTNINDVPPILKEIASIEEKGDK